MSHQHNIGHMGTGFYGSNDPTNSVKALKANDRSVSFSTSGRQFHVDGAAQQNERPP